MNQYLLRHVSVRILGIAVVQMDFFMATVLYISREGFRSALLRSSPDVQNRDKVQEVVNLAYVPAVLGILVALFAAGYLMVLNQGSRALDQWPQFIACLGLYAVACIMELLVEPLFILLQIRAFFNTRVILEAAGTLAFCCTTLVLILCDVGRPLDQQWDVEAYGLGRLAYASTLVLGYLFFISRNSRSILPTADAPWFRLIIPRRISTTHKAGSAISTTRQGKVLINAGPQMYLFDRDTVAVASSLTKQNLFRHFLTEGDKFLLSLLSAPAEQGVYGFVFNYGRTRSLMQRSQTPNRIPHFKVLWSLERSTYPWKRVSESPLED